MSNRAPFFAGVDIGSLTTKTVIVDSAPEMVAYAIIPTGASSRKAADASLAEALSRAGLQREDLATVISTGYGRDIVTFASGKVTEITCHARGAWFLRPDTRTVLDVGGQDSKAIRINERGQVVNFAMNDKCAAGTGRFLEVMARALEVDLEDMADLSMRSTRQVAISSMCTVFAESEVVSLVALGVEIEDIIDGLHRAIASRLFSLLERVGVEQQLTMTGGVAKNAGLVRAIGDRLGIAVWVPEEPQIVGALGAAIIAAERSAVVAKG